MGNIRLRKQGLAALVVSAIAAGIIDACVGKGSIPRGYAAALILASLLCMLIFVGIASKNHTQLALNALLALAAVLIGRLLLAF